MLIRKNKHSEPLESEVTDHQIYLNRRQFLNTSATIATATMLPMSLAVAGKEPKPTFTDLVTSDFADGEESSSFEAITTYNNFYEFGTSKSSPAVLATEFPDKSQPWKVTIDGECDNPGDYHYDDLIRPFTMEERIYRLRCVEGWS
ncbi:MAG: mononuclear molybdenum enzyme YedY, partial [Proteobacteria bacterium]|nr:mononuclear molybdenum enzyme YedY [Pseudomonadota bacterium]